MHTFLQQRFDHWLCRSSCLNYLHRLGFVLKRPKKRLLKVNAEKRDAFVALYAALRRKALAMGASIFLVDEAHFRANVELRAKWVSRGEPAFAGSTCPKLGEKATYHSGVCLETGEVEFMALMGNSTAETSVAFLRSQLDASAILRLLKQAVEEHQVKISLHAAEGALAEEITRPESAWAMLNAQLLEDYPDWWLGPSCLIHGRTASGRGLHLVVSYTELPVTISTVYEPRPPKWSTPTVRGGQKR